MFNVSGIGRLLLKVVRTVGRELQRTFVDDTVKGVYNDIKQTAKGTAAYQTFEEKRNKCREKFREVLNKTVKGESEAPKNED